MYSAERHTGIFSGALSFLSKFIWKTGKNKGEQDTSHNGRSRQRIKNISPEKYRKIEELCEKMFQTTDAVNSGKIQFLNFEQVKTYMGSRWKSVEPIVLSIADEVILKYVGRDDIYFRYNEDDYMIIFAKGSLQEAQMKCALIAAEIQRLLFENLEELEEAKELKTSFFTKTYRRADISDSSDFIEHMSTELSDEIEKGGMQVDLRSLVPKTVIEAPINKKTSSESHASEEKTVAPPCLDNIVFYSIPLMNKDRKERNFVIINDKEDGFHHQGSPIMRYHIFFESLSKSRKAMYEMIILDKIIAQLKETSDKHFLFSLDYQTVLSDHYTEIYKRKFLALNPAEKSRLDIYISHIPEQAPLPTLERLIAPLEFNCHSIYAFIPFHPKKNLSNMINCGFKGVGFMVSDKEFSSTSQFVRDGSILITRCKQYGLTTSMLIASNNPAFINAAIDMECDNIGLTNESLS